MNESVPPTPPRQARRDSDFALIRWLVFHYLGTQKSALLIAILCMLGGAVSVALFAYMFDPMVKFLLVDKRADMVLVVPAIAIGVAVMRALFNYGEAVFLNAVGQGIVARAQRDMVRAIAALDLAELNAIHSGQLISSFLYDATLLRDALTRGVAAGAKEILTLILFAALLIYESWQLSIVALLAIPIVFLVTHALGRVTRKASTRGMVETEGLSTALSEMLSGRRVVRAYGLEANAISRVVASIDKRLQFLLTAARSASISSPAADTINAIATSVVFLVAGYQSLSGQLEINAFAGFMAALLLAQMPLRNIANLWTITSSGLGAAQRVRALIETSPSIVDAADAKPLKFAPAPFGGNLHFENLCFRYHPGQPTLDGVSFNLAAGKKIALVGPSGAGKSTVFNLLLRFYDADSGTIEIDGQNIRGVTIESLRSAIALVTQDPFLFDESIRANIGYGRAGASFEDIVAAAKAAAAHEFIEKLPQGYDSAVGEGAVRLSGGQRQRIAIARAMLRDAPILLLDEATSALDAENERLVQNALRRLMKGRTTIVIAHRLSTIVDADTIHVLDQGRIVESGAHRELIAKGGLYAQLYQRDFKIDDDAVVAVPG
jgi:subfamily B ATP-binding cassette protein MsbA